MTVSVPPNYNWWRAQVEHRTTDSSNPLVDASTNTRFHDIPVKSASRLVLASGQPVAGNGGAGEFHVAYKITRPYGTWRAIPGTIAEALSAGELTAVALAGEGYAARDGIKVGSILKITGLVAADTPDSVIIMVVRVTAITLSAGSADTIDFEHIWNSVSRACDTGATLQRYDTTVPNGSALSEDIWRDLNTTVDEADDGSEAQLTLASEGIAATKGIVAGSILKIVGVLLAVANYEYVLVTAVTLAGGQPDKLETVRGYWGSTAVAKDTGATLYLLEGQIIDEKALSSVNDNTFYNPTTFNDDYVDFGPHDFLRSIAVGAAECRVNYTFVPYKGTRN